MHLGWSWLGLLAAYFWALLWCGHLRRSEGLGVHSMRPVWFCTWPRSSSACYSLILVLARVGWRGGPGRVRIGLVVAHFSLGGERHMRLGPAN